jgi:hypothetical protein
VASASPQPNRRKTAATRRQWTRHHPRTQALRGEQAQTSAQAQQAQIGSKPPSTVSQQALPDQATSDVPQTKRLLFVKLPDRILLIDPDEQAVAEIIPTDDTSSHSSGSSGRSGNQ